MNDKPQELALAAFAPEFAFKFCLESLSEGTRELLSQRLDRKNRERYADKTTVLETHRKSGHKKGDAVSPVAFAQGIVMDSLREPKFRVDKPASRETKERTKMVVALNRYHWDQLMAALQKGA